MAEQQQQYAFNNDPRLQSGLTTGVNGGGGRPLHIMIPRPPSSQEPNGYGMTAPGYVQQGYPANPVYGGGYPGSSNRPPLPPRQPLPASEGGWKMSQRRPPMHMPMPAPQQHPSRPLNQMYPSQPQQPQQYPPMPSPSHSMPYPPPQRPDIAPYPLHPPISPRFPQTMDHQRPPPSPLDPVPPFHSYPPPATPTHTHHHHHHHHSSSSPNSMYPPPPSTTTSADHMSPHGHSQPDAELVSSPIYPPPSSTTTMNTQTIVRPPPPPPPLPPRMPMPMPTPTPSRNGHRYQAFQPQVAYPPPGYFRPPSQDFISRFRSSTVQSFQSSAPQPQPQPSVPPTSTVEQAEEELEEALKSTLRRYDSGKYTTSSSDTSDEEEQDDDDDTAATTPTQYSSKKLREKPLPPTPPPAAAAASRSTPPPPPVPALLSSVSRSFALQMKEVVSLRQLSFSNEYPNAFTGQEAVDTMLDMLQDQFPHQEHLREHCLAVLNALMTCKPFGLIEPVDATKKLRKHIVYDSPDETYRLRTGMTIGVFTPLTKCYVDGCEPGQGGCYAPRCPNKPAVQETDLLSQERLIRSISMRSSMSHEEGAMTTDSWGARMAPDFYETIDARERDRQEAMNEIIHGEEQYLKDMELLQNCIVTPLQQSSVIDPSEWELFSRDVFNNHQEIYALSMDFFNDLYGVYHEHENECLPGIGSILLEHFQRFRDPYALYVPNVHLAEYIVADLKQANTNFKDFLQSRLTDPQLNRHSFRHFLLRPVMRIARYPLLLQALIKKTDEDDPEYETLQECYNIISEVAAFCDQLAAGVKTRVEILLLNSALTCRQGESYDLKLTDPQRKIYYRGDLRRENSKLDVLEVHEKYIHMIVFDHIVLLTKARKTSDGTQYKIWRRPIPLQMLHIQGTDNDFSLPTQYLTTLGSTAHNIHTSLRTSTGLRSSTIMNSTTMVRNAHSALSLVLTHPGRHGGSYAFACADEAEKLQWLHALKQARSDMKLKTDAFNAISLESTFFRDYSASSTMEGSGKVTSSVPFVSAVDGVKMLAIGTSTGVYFKRLPEGRARPILSLKNVTQLDVMQAQQILLVLADKVLYAYPLDELTSTKNSKAPDRLKQEITDPVHFFQTGVCNGMELLVAARQRTVSTSFVAFKPERHVDSDGSLTTPTSSSSSHHHHHIRLRTISQRHLFRHHGSRSSWFSTYKEFSVGAHAIDIHFLKSKFAIVCDKAFEIIDPEDLSSSRSIPNDHDPQFYFLQQRKDNLRPLAMYRIQSKFLLCYNKFAFYVDNRRQGLIPRDRRSALLCEWECYPEAVVYHHPYIIAFDQRFVEVRHVETGDLVQMIPGNDCRLTYYGSSADGDGSGMTIQGCIVHAKNHHYQDVFYLEPHNVEQQQGNHDDDT